MFTCKICKRKFKSEQALGGHVSHAHPQTKPDAASSPVAAPSAEPASPAMAAEPPAAQKEPQAEKQSPEPQAEAQPPEEEEGEGAQVSNYLKRGYTFDLLTKQFGFSPRTVRREIEKLVPPEGEAPPAGPGDGIPLMRKAGPGVEVLNPEVVLRLSVNGDADQAELRGMLRLRAAMLMVMDLINIRKADAEAFALEVKPILDLMKETRAEQDAAAERSRSSSLEASREAARETVQQVMPYLDDRLKGVESAVQQAQQRSEPKSSPFPQFMKMLDGMMTTMSQQMFSGFGMKPQGGEGGQTEVPGFTYKKRGESNA